VRSAIVPVTSCPATTMRPDVGGIAVASRRRSVLLPAPLGPRRHLRERGTGSAGREWCCGGQRDDEGDRLEGRRGGGGQDGTAGLERDHGSQPGHAHHGGFGPGAPRVVRHLLVAILGERDDVALRPLPGATA